MSKKKTLNLISMCLGLIAIAMIVIGIKMNILPPSMTGIGFLLIAWALRALR